MSLRFEEEIFLLGINSIIGLLTIFLSLKSCDLVLNFSVNFTSPNSQNSFFNFKYRELLTKFYIQFYFSYAMICPTNVKIIKKYT
ncbi:hypothetical protein BpHYR1_023369 [Brachionus plicatilis]|uniref:Uncharacterized protein n=1 Tax=Brachionus plicatilis TaxID=10195 RepID=A0A3M7QCK3_BRAPC|nr:hypothetical protein BpHYR1_023369 [Brachionus plicatilis]